MVLLSETQESPTAFTSFPDFSRINDEYLVIPYRGRGYAIGSIGNQAPRWSRLQQKWDRYDMQQICYISIHFLRFVTLSFEAISE
jgi:hypothetical protein